MLISPPFLPPRAANQTQDEWIDAAMPGGEPGNGAYPLSYNLGWHGGLHLQAPILGNGREPVRAIADGVVVYRRGSSEPPSPPAADDPLGYGGRTSDGVIVLRHETEIGAANQGDVPTRVVFFSVYMHLHTLRNSAQQGRNVYRKEELGQAGYIRGRPDQIHFEIICDETNLRQLVGRSGGDVPLTADGRADAIFGELYFQLSANTLVYAQCPPRNQAAPAGGLPLGEDLFVGLRYAEGDGEQGARGNAYITSYGVTGTPLGASLSEAEAEYKLFKDTKAISEAYPQSGRPIHSAVYDLLRFGRIVGSDALVPADVPHWRQIRTPAGMGWVNLNGEGVHKFSDADFPQWRGWRFVEDAQDGNSLCNDPTILQALDVNSDGTVTPEEAEARLSAPEIQASLRKLICKFPTEWEAATIEARWGWLKTQIPNNPSPLSEDQFSRLKQHISALAFWEQANLQVPQYDAHGNSAGSQPLSSVHWRFDPREFVRIFRRAGWLSINELAQCIPRNVPEGQITWEVASTRATTHALALNRYFRKFYGASPQRVVHALCQIYIETGILALFSEGGAGSGHAYGPFYGRGYMQLTWAGNYKAYGAYRKLPDHAGSYSDSRITTTSTHPSSDGGEAIRWYPRFDPEIVADDLSHGGESSGFFWVTKSFRGTSNMNRAADLSVTSTIVGFCCWLVNGGGNGYDKRHRYSKYLVNILLDEPLRSGVESYSYPPLTPKVNLGTTDHPNWTPLLCSTFPPTEVNYSVNGSVNHEPQRP